MDSHDASVMASHIVLDGLLPAKVDAAKRDKFQTVLKSQIVKEFLKKNPAVPGFDTNSFTLTFVTDPDTKFVTAAFLGFKSISDAEKAVASLNQWKFTKSVECSAYFWADFEKFSQIPDEYSAPEGDDETLNLEDLKANDFLLDGLARPQLLVKGGASLHVDWFWFGKNKTADLIKTGKTGGDHAGTWSEVDQIKKQLQPGIPKEMPMWSPQGTYLITQHQQSICFWGGKGMQKLSELVVEDLQYFGVSPCETYAITYSREFAFWNILEGRKVRTLPGAPMKRGQANCPFKYNSDDSLIGIAKLDAGKENLSFYNATTMALISPEAKPYTAKVDGLAAFDWSPRDPSIFACTVEGDKHTGWCIEVSSVQEDGHIRNISRRNVLQATRVDLLWHPDGSHVAARVTKIERGEEVFDYLVMTINYNSVATHTVSIKGRKILRFNWANKKPRFSVTLAADPKNSLPSGLAFFAVQQKGCHLIETVNIDVDSVYWSTKGKEAVTLNRKNYSLNFFVVDEKDQGVEKVAKEVSHPGASDVAWDPSGRFVCSYISTVGQESFGEPGYKIWSVFGDLLDSNVKFGGRFSHLMWRPLPRTLLSEEALKKIEKELPKKKEKYEAEENELQRKTDEAKRKKETDTINKYLATMQAIEAHHKEKNFAEIRADLRASAPALKRQQAKLAKITDLVTEFEEEVVILDEKPME